MNRLRFVPDAPPGGAPPAPLTEAQIKALVEQYTKEAGLPLTKSEREQLLKEIAELKGRTVLSKDDVVAIVKATIAESAPKPPGPPPPTEPPKERTGFGGREVTRRRPEEKR